MKSQRLQCYIIHGFPESDHSNDGDDFSDFCETNLGVKPAVISYRRIGRHNPTDTSSADQRPRRLLVKLRSAQSALDLRYASRTLSHSSDVNIRNIHQSRSHS